MDIRGFSKNLFLFINIEVFVCLCNVSHLLIIYKAQSALLVGSQFGKTAHCGQNNHVELFTLKLLN